LAWSGLGWAGLGKLMALPLLIVVACSPQDVRVPLSLAYSIIVEDFRSPCPARCTQLPFENTPAGMVTDIFWQDWPEAQAMGNPLGVSGPVYESIRPSCGVGKACDCDIHFGFQVFPEFALGEMTIDIQKFGPFSGWRRWETLYNSYDTTPPGESVTFDGWSIEMIGEFPMPLPASDYDPAYEDQEFHIIGTPDEYIEPDPDSCTGDLRSLSFDFRFIPLNPYGE
jgi:hypothetical protein